MKILRISGWLRAWFVLILIWTLLVVIAEKDSMPSAEKILQQRINDANQTYSQIVRHDEDAYRHCIMPMSGKPDVQKCEKERQEREAQQRLAHQQLSDDIVGLKKNRLDGKFNDEAEGKRLEWVMQLLILIALPLAILGIALKTGSILLHYWLVTAPETRFNIFMRAHLVEMSAATVLGLLVALQLAVLITVVDLSWNTSSRSFLLSISDLVLLAIILIISMYLSKKQWPSLRWAVVLIRFAKGMSVALLMGAAVYATQRDMSMLVLVLFVVFVLAWAVTGTNLKATKAVGLIWMISVMSPLDIFIPALTYADLSKGASIKILETRYGLASDPAPEGYVNMGCLVPIYPPTWLLVVNPWPLLTDAYPESKTGQISTTVK